MKKIDSGVKVRVLAYANEDDTTPELHAKWEAQVVGMVGVTGKRSLESDWIAVHFDEDFLDDDEDDIAMEYFYDHELEVLND